MEGSIDLNTDEIISEPKRYSFVESLSIDAMAKSKVSNNLSRIEKGSDDILVSPLGKGDLSPNDILDRWNVIFQSNITSINQELLDLEESNKDKFGPRSIAAKWDVRRDSLYDYFGSDVDPHPLSYDFDNFGGLRPTNVSTAVSKMKNNTSTGLPYMLKKRDVKQRLVSEFNEDDIPNQPCVLFTRTQEQGKTRNVWGYPVEATLLEMLYYIPLLAHQRRQPYRCALISPEATDSNVTKIINNLATNESLYSVDLSQCDARLRSLQKYVFLYIKRLFNNAYDLQIDKVSHLFKHIEIVSPDGILSGEHGVPSGSTFTNEVDSLAQYIVFRNCGLSPEKFVIQGDDALVACTEDQKTRIDNMMRSYGMLVNEEKSYFTHFGVYLQNLYSTDYKSSGIISGIYPVYRALNRLIYQERWSNFEDYGISGKDYYSIRSISILENCKHHPLFEEFVRFVYEIDKYNLEYSENGLAKYIDSLDLDKSSVGGISNQYGDDVRGISNFSTVKLIRSFRL